jgi:hypothetical protein
MYHVTSLSLDMQNTVIPSGNGVRKLRVLSVVHLEKRLAYLVSYGIHPWH